MKKITSLLLFIALTLSLGAMLVSCDLISGGNDTGTNEAYGYYTVDGKGYFVTADGAVEIDGGAAKEIDSAPEGTPESKKFEAPETFAATFTTETFGSGVAITGVSGAEVVMVPKTINGKAVLGIKAGAFDGVKAVIIGNLRNDEIRTGVEDGAFKGVGSVYIATSPTQLQITNTGTLLKDCGNLKINISADEISNFKTHYEWGKIKDSLQKY